MNAKRVTPECQQERLAYASNLSQAELELMTVPVLRALIRDLGINSVNRDGEYIPLSKARKAELIEGIQKAVAPTKIAKVYTSTEMTAEEIENSAASFNKAFEGSEIPDIASITTKTFNDLEKAVRALWDNETQTWLPTRGVETIAANLTNYLVSRRNVKTGEPLSVFTVLNYKSAVLKAMEQRLSEMEVDPVNRPFYFPTLQAIYQNDFRNFVNSQVSSLTKEKADKESVAIDKRQNDMKVVDLTEALNWANETLESINSVTPKLAWREVSIALALVTGRRMGEIHATAEFEKTGEYSLRFSGQLKTKGVAKQAYELEPSYEIPTLVKADLVLKGMEFLTRVGRVFKTGDIEADIKLVNKRLNSAISELVNKDSSIIKPLLGLSPEVKLTYHSLRQLYNLAAVKAFKPSNVKSFVYSGFILGHSRQMSEGKKDVSTTTRYESDFELASDSLTHI
jgi:hypothetical protein